MRVDIEARAGQTVAMCGNMSKQTVLNVALSLMQPCVGSLYLMLLGSRQQAL
jgi:hypothetical protein